MRRLISILAIAMVGLVACGGQAIQPSTKVSAHALDLSVIRVADYRYKPFDSPETLAADKTTEILVAGEVEGFSSGRFVRGKSRSDDSYFVVMKIRVSDKLKTAGHEAAVSDGNIYVEFFQGGTCPNDLPCVSIDGFSRAIPSGTKVLFFGSEASEPVVLPDGGVVENAEVGRPAGVPLLKPYPQGLIFEEITSNGAHLVGGGEDLSHLPPQWKQLGVAQQGIAGLVQRLRDAGFNG